ncbi:MAG: Phosphoribosyl-ATP pyrophosphohydrolase [Firmicutes bacterium ADurb.Bin506]|nr:MAG: Phosphoribosyl-ATP pyrophosphohydrolase [Firmicutes bacterium ADurb.Bin506]
MTNLPVGAAVRYFHQLMGTPAPDTPPLPNREILTWDRWGLRLSLIDEEYEELHEAFEENDAAKFLDACVDMVYVIVGTAVEAGLPFDEAFAAVHAANMEKAPECGNCKYSGSGVDPECPMCAGRGRIVSFRDDGKVLKPEDWSPPDIKGLIETYR